MDSSVPGPSATGREPGAHWVPERPPEDLEGDPTLGDESDLASSTASLSSSVLAYRTLNGRTYHNQDRTNTEYWAPNDEMQNRVLDLQHHAFTLALGGKLYEAPLAAGKLTKALDIGTGTGIWAIDFADEHPECEVIGTDISPIQPGWVPPNLKFEIEDFNSEWTFEPGSIDYVHMRFLTGAIPDYAELVQQAYACLKPGGFVEAFDVDFIMSSEDGSVTEKSALGQLYNLHTSTVAKLGLKTSFAPIRENLWEKAMEAAGFVNIKMVNMKIPLGSWPKDKAQKEIGLVELAVLTTDLEGSLNFAFDTLGWSRVEAAVYCAHLRAETKQPSIHTYNDARVIYAQKPEEA